MTFIFSHKRSKIATLLVGLGCSALAFSSPKHLRDTITCLQSALNKISLTQQSMEKILFNTRQTQLDTIVGGSTMVTQGYSIGDDPEITSVKGVYLTKTGWYTLTPPDESDTSNGHYYAISYLGSNCGLLRWSKLVCPAFAGQDAIINTATDTGPSKSKSIHIDCYFCLGKRITETSTDSPPTIANLNQTDITSNAKILATIKKHGIGVNFMQKNGTEIALLPDSSSPPSLCDLTPAHLSTEQVEPTD